MKAGGELCRHGSIPTVRSNHVPPCRIAMALGHLRRLKGGDETGRYLMSTR